MSHQWRERIADIVQASLICEGTFGGGMAEAGSMGPVPRRPHWLSAILIGLYLGAGLCLLIQFLHLRSGEFFPIKFIGLFILTTCTVVFFVMSRVSFFKFLDRRAKDAKVS